MAGTFNPGQPRAPKGTSIGGRWVKTPGGGMRAPGPETMAHRKQRTWVKRTNAKDRWDQTFTVRPLENTVEEDMWRAKEEERQRQIIEREKQERQRLLRGKKEANARFAAKEKMAHDAGMRGPATIRKILREQNDAEMAAGVPLKDKVNMGKEGVWRRGWRRGGQWMQIGNQFNVGGLSPEGKHKLEFIEANGVHMWIDVTPPKGKTTLANEKHARHVALRAAKAREVHLLGKRIAGQKHIAKKKGLPFVPPAKPQFGNISPGGKFIFDQVRNPGQRRWHPGWKLIPTQDRAGAQPAQLGHRVNVVQNAPRPPRVPTPQPVVGTNFRDVIATANIKVEHDNKGNNVRRTDDGKDVFIENRNLDPGHGIFKKEFVNDQNGVGYLLKSDGYGNRGGRGYAHREVAAYEISNLLGLDIVPVTTPKVISGYPLQGDHGSYHSLQKLADDAEIGQIVGDDRIRKEAADPEEPAKMLMFDMLMGNTDRHGQNYMLSNQSLHNAPSHLIAIDNGLMMTSTATNLDGIRSAWRAHRLVDPGRIKLNSKYRDNLDTALKSGAFEKIVRDVQAHTNSDVMGNATPEQAANAVMTRARNLVLEWDQQFIN